MTSVKNSWNDLIEKLNHIIEKGSEKPGYFQKVRGLFDESQKLVLYDDLRPYEVNLVHYTTWNNALNMFDPSVDVPIMRMYNYEQSNDPDEGRIIPSEWKKVIDEANWIADYSGCGNMWERGLEFGGSTYGCSFSSGPSGVEDDLTYWRLYGNDGDGCSLKISSTHDFRIYKVRYRDEKTGTEQEEEDRQVAERLRSLFRVGKMTVEKSPGKYKPEVGKVIAEGLQKIIYGYCHLIKHKAYAGEEEWRMINVMPRPDEVQYEVTSENLVKRYVEGPALRDVLVSSSSITIGPTVPNRGAARAYVEHLVNKVHKMRNVDVKNSDKTYRSSPFQSS